ncbi:hypothetical protein Tco_0861159 [Tanacetum coccineum]|uniref:Reverse transcriptase domain-containing protein n=1 Tax=Tanacetum coccineum TaxID=301880 RepID=A0ABQ5BJ76_9ASTR
MLKISLKEAESGEEIFFFVAWVRAFNIHEPIYPELCREFYATYEFDEVCVDDELQSKKIISFRLGGRAHSLTLLEFARRLGLHHAYELEEEGFDTYFQGGLRSYEKFNAREYWERICIDRDLHLSRSLITYVRFPILGVLHKMITYGLCQRTTRYEKIQRNDLWLLSIFEARHQNGYANVAWVIAKWIKRKGAGSQKDSQICCSQFISKIARKSRVLTEEIVRTLINDVLEIAARELQEYQGIFEHIVRFYNVPLQGDYNPPGYAQPRDRNEGSGDWDSPEYKDTAGSGGRKNLKLWSFTKWTLKRIVIVKLCLEYEVKKGKKLVKKELMVLLRGEIYFVQFIINPEEDEFEPVLIFGRSFLRSANAIINFGEVTITIQPDFDPFLLSSDEEWNPNLDNLETLIDFDFDEVPQTETDLPPMVCKMGKGSRNKKKIMENIMYFNYGAGPSSSVGTPLTQKEAKKRALAHNISMRYEMLEEVRPIKPEEEREMVKVKGQMLKEKKDPGAFIFPIRLEGLIYENALADTGSGTNTMPYEIYEQLGRDDIMKEDRNIPMINYTEAELTSRKIRKIRTAKRDSNDEEDYVIKRNDMGTPIHNSRPIGYQNNTNHAENITLSTLESVINPFRKISVWKKALSFLGLLTAKLRDVEWKPDYKLCYSNPELATGQWKTEIRLTNPYGNIYILQEHTIIRSGHPVPNALGMLKPLKKHYSHMFTTNSWSGVVVVEKQSLVITLEEIDNMLKISLKESKTREEIFFYVAWVRSFNIREPIYLELCREFYATYEFDEVCADDELQSKKIISFRLGGRAHSLTLLEFSRRLGLYHAEELNEEGLTLRELIDSEDRSIPDIPVDDVPRVAAQGAPRGDYNPPGYAQPQYDQYYQRYYPQQQHDDEENE